MLERRGELRVSCREQCAPSLEAFGGIDRALDVAQIPDQPGYLGLDVETLRATFRFASRLRARYTAIDFLEGQGALAGCVRHRLWPG